MKRRYIIGVLLCIILCFTACSGPAVVQTTHVITGGVTATPTPEPTPVPTPTPEPTLPPLIIPSYITGAEAAKGISPIVVGGYLLGGVKDGSFVQIYDLLNREAVVLKDFVYDIYGFNGTYRGQAMGSSLLNQYDGTEWTAEVKDMFPYSRIDFDLIHEEDDPAAAATFIAIKTKWNPFPREVKEIPAEKVHNNAVINELKEKGIKDPTLQIKVYQVDLNNDGVLETIIAAQNIPRGTNVFDTIQKGDYGMVLLMTQKGKKITTQVVNSYIVKEDPEDPSVPYRLLFDVASVMDLDGDAQMEVIIHDYYYEGEGYQVYKLEPNGRMSAHLSNGFGS